MHAGRERRYIEKLNMNTEISGFPGLSGCIIEVFRNTETTYVRKITRDMIYAPRLKKQAQKQREFFLKNSLPYLLIPEIIREDEGYDYYSFEMPYYRSKNYIEFFQNATRSDIDSIVNKLIEFVEYNLAESSPTEITKEKLLDKYYDVQKKTSENSIIDIEVKEDIFRQSDSIFSVLEDSMSIPVGYCHGDLTFSNILFNKDKKEIVLLDWLDTFIETPLQDIVKLRQDSKYYWSLNLYQSSFDRTKMLLVMEYVDKKIDTYFAKHSFYNDYYRVFQLLNFLRILPYAKKESTVSFLKKSIEAIISDQ
ncbi:MAG: phosphotransferase [Candidatus Yanofskybacteria bacterium]|nr:phosphotransferase [Candidatus Yanofskybacteria bacterium]